MKLFSDQIPAADEPLPQQMLLRVNWWEGIAMTGACLIFTLGALWMIASGKGALAFFALFVFAPGLLLGWRQIRTGGYFVEIDCDQLSRSDHGQRDCWTWLSIEACKPATRDGVEGVWCHLRHQADMPDFVIEPGGRDVKRLAELLERYRLKAVKRAENSPRS